MHPLSLEPVFLLSRVNLGCRRPENGDGDRLNSRTIFDGTVVAPETIKYRHRPELFPVVEEVLGIFVWVLCGFWGWKGCSW